MYKLWVAILRDFRILIRDKAALAIMFAMPVLLVIVVSSIQDNGFKMMTNRKVPILLSNHDGGECSKQLTEALQKIGMFDISSVDPALNQEQLTELMHTKDALITVVIPSGFSQAISGKSNNVATKALKDLGVSPKGEVAPAGALKTLVPVTMYYNPVAQESFRYSVQGALQSAQQFTENRQVLQAIYKALNNQGLPDSLEKELLSNQAMVNEIPLAKGESRVIPNSTQHNVPAWTIFAMFFIVVSLSSNVVKEKMSGSFLRLKTLPTNYVLSLLAKQITYIGVALAQVLVIFSLGIYLFPALGLPRLVLPSDIFSLLLVSVVCGWCAVSYGVLIGVYAKTLEQAIGFGAVSVVILAAIGGIVMPGFAMPTALKLLMKVSPMHWCMEAYYTLFLEGGFLKDVLYSLLPLFVITLAFQIMAITGLKRQHLI